MGKINGMTRQSITYFLYFQTPIDSPDKTRVSVVGKKHTDLKGISLIIINAISRFDGASTFICITYCTYFPIWKVQNILEKKKKQKWLCIAWCSLFILSGAKKDSEKKEKKVICIAVGLCNVFGGPCGLRALCLINLSIRPLSILQSQ